MAAKAAPGIVAVQSSGSKTNIQTGSSKNTNGNLVTTLIIRLRETNIATTKYKSKGPA